MLWICLHTSLLFLFCSLITDFLKFALNNTHCLVLRWKLRALPAVEGIGTAGDVPSTYFSQASSLSHKSRPPPVNTDEAREWLHRPQVPAELSRTFRIIWGERNKKKKLAAGFSVSYVFQCENLLRGVGMWNVRWRLWIRISQKVSRSRRGPSAADEASRKEERRSARFFYDE